MTFERFNRPRRANTNPMRAVVHAAQRAGMWSVGVPGAKTHWWELALECGHNVERSMRYVPGDASTPRGWARMWHGRSRDEQLPAPKRVRCEQCGRATP